MTERTYQQVVNERMKAEIAAFEADRRAKGQMELDFWMEQKLIERADRHELRERLDPFNYGHWR